MTEGLELPIGEYAFPGPLRDKLVAAILDGIKTSTSSLVLGYEREGEPLPKVGDRELVVDSQGHGVVVTEITDVRVCPLSEVTLEHAIAEGEGYRSVAEWREGHEAFWHSPEVRDELGDPTFMVDDSTLIVCTRFRCI